MSSISLSRIKKALATLVEGYKPDPSTLERDGLIQRFEYSFELAWKTSRRVLEASGIQTDTPKNIFRELARLGWIESPEPWFRFLEAHRKTVSVYDEGAANEAFPLVPEFMREAKRLLAALEKHVK